MRALRILGIVAAVTLTAFVIFLVFARVLYVDSRFGPGELVIDSTVRVEVSAYGSWRRGDWNGRLAEISGSPYLVAVTISGVGDSATITTLQIADSVTGEIVEITEWAMQSYSAVDSTLVLATKQEISLKPGNKQLRGELRIGGPGASMTRQFSGHLPHAIREQRRRWLTVVLTV